MIPEELKRDRYWRSTLHIFLESDRLRQFVATHIDFDARTINTGGLKRISRPWSQSERFMLNLALHLFNEQHKLSNLSDMDYLDSNNKRIALEAIKLRFM
ncbi:hypothetical protein [Paenibacillus antibioticophila]|uniref:hypothetical protein n=1 Tax=Paenibacillus antibioticophila TaxID=1274374 RepID=UPI0005C89A88|nr:hypothetical protein [Paenibacillus antibioticophila]